MSDAIARVTQYFLDRELVMKKVAAAKRRAISRQAGSIRTRARFSMRKRKASSLPGQPPSVHRGDLKRLLFYAWDTRTESAVVGPVPLKKVPAEEPSLLEHGGEVTRTVPKLKTGGRRASKKQAASFKRKVKDGSIQVPKRERETRTLHYRKFPYMGPAEEETRPGFAGQFKDEVR